MMKSHDERKSNYTKIELNSIWSKYNLGWFQALIERLSAPMSQDTDYFQLLVELWDKQCYLKD